MDDHRFDLVFEKLAEAQAKDDCETTVSVLEASADEMREIDELRRYTMEVSFPTMLFYTGR